MSPTPPLPADFPDMGGMFFKAGGLKFDPQFIKPPAGYKGSDQIDFTNKATTTLDGNKAGSPAPAVV